MTYYKKAWAVFRQNWRLIVPFVIAASVLSSALLRLQLPLKWIPVPKEGNTREIVELARNFAAVLLTFVGIFPTNILFVCFCIVSKGQEGSHVTAFPELWRVIKPRIVVILKTTAIIILSFGVMSSVAIALAYLGNFWSFLWPLMVVVYLLFIPLGIIAFVIMPLTYSECVFSNCAGFLAIENAIRRLLCRRLRGVGAFIVLLAPAIALRIVRIVLPSVSFSVVADLAELIVTVIPIMATCILWNEVGATKKKRRKR